MIKTGLGIIIMLCIFTENTLLANEISSVEAGIESAESDQELLDELMGIVDESTAIATKTRMNANSVPGTVTVLQGKELEKLGITTAWDALALVPGILPSKDTNGGTSVVARGLNFPFSSGNIKILVNSLSMSRETSGINSTILQIPIEQIKRIEVVRGPGAVLYGDNAFLGLVNIITYTEDQRLFTRVEGNGAVSGGAMGSYNNDQHQIHVHGNVYVYDNDSADTPNSVITKEERQFGVFSLRYQGFSLSAQSYHRDFEPLNRALVREGSDIFSARQKITLSPTLSSELNFSFLQNDFNQQDVNYNGDKIEGSIDFNWKGLKDHQWWFRFSYTDESINNAFRLRRRPPPGRPQRPPLSLSNISRKHYSLSLQDQFELTDSLTITGSLRFDHRDDLGKDFFSPRISAVWRITDQHILKAQYAEGFRVPTFFELYNQTGRLNLIQETIATSELAYIYHQTSHTGKITLFYSHIDDMIFPHLNTFANMPEAESYGFELEWQQQLTEQLKWQANLSYVNSWSSRTADGSRQEDRASADWLSNVALFYRPIEKLVLSVHWHYSGQRNKPGTDVAAENSLNLTASAFDIITQGLDFKLGVKNLLKDNEQYLIPRPNNLIRLDYEDKVMVWAQISYQF